MKNVGIVRSIDGVGRIVLPIEIRKQLQLTDENSMVEINAKGNEITIKKYTPSCMFCHEEKNLLDFEGQKICRSCVEKISKL